jgi:hypothetical protein
MLRRVLIWIHPLNLICGLFLATTSSFSAETENEFFRSKVEPILKQYCYECHSHAGGKAKGGLVLDSRNGWFKGGESGPAVVPGQAQSSRLIQAVGYADNDLQMPPAGRLSDSEIEHLRKWVEMGAPDPRVQFVTKHTEMKEGGASRGKDFWSFQSRKDPTPPKSTELPARAPLDLFINKRLADAGLSPVAAADPGTLLRRVSFDLTGLPPTPHDVESFVADVAPGAFERVVDRLLGDPGFGEQWARHWLDLSAYADTIGTGRALPATNAWRFRDYVIASFNEDKPYDQFVREQLAGDLIGTESIAERRRNLTATGFLALGPWPLENGDKPQLRMDIVDFQIKRVGKVFLGMTFGCARCHDHKFDPVSQRDYYAMAGIFGSTMTLKGRMVGIYSDVYRAPLPETAADMIQRAERLEFFERQLQRVGVLQSRIQSKAKTLEKEEDAIKAAGRKADKRFASKLKAAKKSLADADARLATLKFNRPVAPVANAVTDLPEPENCRINIRGNARSLGDEVPRGYVDVISWETKTPQFAAGQSGRMELAQWVADAKNPLTARVLVNRVWQQLFGTGLVASPDNFGLRGQLPSHPELLEHLAGRFVDGGWSVKSLIRMIVLSETYRRGSTDNVAARKIDPDNRLLWRANRRRLQAESIRDAMLMAAGDLDRAGGGPSLPVSYHQNLALAPPVAIYDGVTFYKHVEPRRSIYQPIKRKSAFVGLGVFDVFDFPSTNEESGKRAVTTVANQALFMMNSKFSKESSAALAKTVQSESQKFRAQIDSLYRRVIGRQATNGEWKRARAFVLSYADGIEDDDLSRKEKRIQALSRFAQALFASNEFLFRR